ncbi:MAG: 2-C-methyl-D-erythritol 4-phosphate cytidylyltransferase [Acidobacteria bacterium]|nr:MAG: 2-C-methyl-D-erythritol 4-phosphate cytidylyltransferase [Acidobacteriota bacterium]
MHVTAIIPAGGRGRRLGAGVPKQFLALAGRPILQRTVEAFLRCPAVAEVIVVLPPEMVDAPPAYLQASRVKVVAGGDRRQDSVANGFDALPAGADIVLIHDAARPLVDEPTIERAIAAASERGAAIAAVAASDTVKLSESAEAQGERLVDRTLARDAIFLAQTPQAFRRAVLAEAVALGRSGAEATDEAALAERAGHRVQIVEGSRRNIKITTSEDLVVAEALLEGRGGSRLAPTGGWPVMRVGTGYDLHRLVEGRPLILGGVTIPFERGLAGHSDADVLAHAITDAILGAASLGDIGHHFPDTDPRWKGASSVELLAHVVALLRERNLVVVNVDATVIAERPQLGPHREAIAGRLACAMCLDRGAVSVKAKTNEGVDATGRGEAIAAHAVALIEQRPAGSPRTAESGQE